MLIFKYGLFPLSPVRLNYTCIFIVLNSGSTISVATKMPIWHQQNWGDYCDRCGFSTSFDNMVSTYRNVTEKKKLTKLPLEKWEI